MKTMLQLLAIVLLAGVALAIVGAVNAPKWMDGKPVAATQPK